MNSSISSSDQAAPVAPAERRAWRRWLLVFCGTFFGIGGLLYALLILIDPYETRRFPSFGIVGIADQSLRTSQASRGRDPRFNASIIGNSTGQMLDPRRISRGTGLSFNQLTIPATRPIEQLAIMRWVIANHSNYRAFVVVTEPTWCSPDPNLPVQFGFPFWLYGDNWNYLANVLNSKSLDRAVWRIMVALGRFKPVDPVGYFNYMAESRGIAFQAPPPPLDGVGARLPPDLPWVDRLGAFLATQPPDLHAVIVMPPVYYTLLSPPGSMSAAVLDACKAALARVVAGRPHSGFLDFHVDSEAAHDPANFNDGMHYGEKLAREIEDGIIGVLRSGEVGPQARRP